MAAICESGSEKKPNAPNTYQITTGDFLTVFGEDSAPCILALEIATKINNDQFLINGNYLFDTQINTSSFCSAEPTLEDINYLDVLAAFITLKAFVFSFGTSLPSPVKSIMDKLVGYIKYTKWFEFCKCKKPIAGLWTCSNGVCSLDPLAISGYTSQALCEDALITTTRYKVTATSPFWSGSNEGINDVILTATGLAPDGAIPPFYPSFQQQGYYIHPVYGLAIVSLNGMQVVFESVCFNNAFYGICGRYGNDPDSVEISYTYAKTCSTEEPLETPLSDKAIVFAKIPTDCGMAEEKSYSINVSGTEVTIPVTVNMITGEGTTESRTYNIKVYE